MRSAAGESSGRIGNYITQSLANVTTAVTVTAGANSTMSAWVELIANSGSVEGGALTIGVNATSQSGAENSTLMDVGFGAAASEVAMVSSVCIGTTSTGHAITLPISVPPGTRISVRMQARGATPPASSVWAFVDKTNRRSPPNLVDHGSNRATSLGVATTTANTWVQVTAATATPFQGLLLSAGLGKNGSTAAFPYVDFGIGPAGAEIALPGFISTTSSQEAYSPSRICVPIWRHVPAGTRLAVRNTDGTNTFTAVIFGIPYT